ncbi:unnamed protein product [Amoebophrya sp. A25]|nr:unnamed protein product [Amoebophrya sp. A25]|eukprot:GSA25T00004407001.1
MRGRFRGCDMLPPLARTALKRLLCRRRTTKMSRSSQEQHLHAVVGLLQAKRRCRAFFVGFFFLLQALLVTSTRSDDDDSRSDTKISGSGVVRRPAAEKSSKSPQDEDVEAFAEEVERLLQEKEEAERYLPKRPEVHLKKRPKTALKEGIAYNEVFRQRVEQERRRLSEKGEAAENTKTLLTSGLDPAKVVELVDRQTSRPSTGNGASSASKVGDHDITVKDTHLQGGGGPKGAAKNFGFEKNLRRELTSKRSYDDPDLMTTSRDLQRRLTVEEGLRLAVATPAAAPLARSTSDKTSAVDSSDSRAQKRSSTHSTPDGLTRRLSQLTEHERQKHHASQWAATARAASVAEVERERLSREQEQAAPPLRKNSDHGRASSIASSSMRRSNEQDEEQRRLQGSSGGVDGVNLALNKGVALSSTGTEVHPNPAIGSRQGSASYAVDGTKGMSFFQDGCAQTWSRATGDGGEDTDDFPWLRVDLGRPEHVGLVRLWPRNDVLKTLTHFEFRVGTIGGDRYDENVICSSGPGGGLSGVTEMDDDGVTLIPGQMNSITCEAFGRYVFILIRKRSAVLSLCEVEVIAQGPVGRADLSAVAGQPFNIYLQGIGMQLANRIRIVEDTILCGTLESRTMSHSVFPLTSPEGPPDLTGASLWEQWSNVTIARAGYYKVCWCGGSCDVGESVFSTHALRLVLTGSIVTISNGVGRAPANLTDPGVVDGVPIIHSAMSKPLDVAVMERGIFVAEGHRIRYLDLIMGQAYRIAGNLYSGNGGDGGLSQAALLNKPAGLTIDKRYYWEFLATDAAFGTATFQTAKGDMFQNTQHFVYRLYLAEQHNHQVRAIEYSPKHLLTTAITEAELYTTTGIISRIAGTGSPGFSGDGGAALLARLDSPSGIYLDAEKMLWLADSLNNRIRIVFLDPLSSRFGKIYTAIGEGPQGYGGDGGNSLRAQINFPKGVVCTHVDPLEEDDEEGRLLRAVVYITEHGNHIGRVVQMHFGETCGLQNGPICGLIDTYVGTPMQSGDLLGNLRSTAFLNAPMGLAFNQLTNMLTMSDWGNHRLIGMPTAQVVSMGCWRDSTDPNAVLLKSLENPNPPSPYLVGDYLTRKNPVHACFLESLRMGFVLFGIRQGGECVSNKNAENTYKAYKTSTTCVDGLGATSDNNIYKIIAPGQALAELGRVFAIANAGGLPGYDQKALADFSIALNAVDTQLHSPSGIDVDPASNNVWIADALNNRVRVIYGQAGPNSGQTYRCTNGMRCIIEIRGNGLMTTDRIGMFPHGTKCGDPKSFFSKGFTTLAGVSTNPATLIPSNMFDAKEFDLGVPRVEKAALFQVCFCPDQSARGSGTAATSATGRVCQDSRYFTTSAGTLTMSGPDRLRLDVRAGEAFHLTVTGLDLHIQDRVMFTPAVDGVTGAARTCMDNFLLGSVQDQVSHLPDVVNMFMYETAITSPYQIPRDFGNTTVSLWQRLELKRGGVYLACWCDGQREPPVGFRSRLNSDLVACRRKGDYQTQAVEVHVHGPYTMDGTFYAPGEMSIVYSAQVATFVQLKLEGSRFRRSDRIRIVKKLSANHKCGTLGSMEFSDTMFGKAPTGPPLIISEYSATWTDFQFKDNKEMLVCFCGRTTGTMDHVSQNFPGQINTKTHDGCVRDEDYNILAGVLKVKGLSATQTDDGIFRVPKATEFALTLVGEDFTRGEKISLVETYINCGSSSASVSSAQLLGDQIENIPMRNAARTEITWSGLRIDSDTILKICYCGGDCERGSNYMLEIGAVLVGAAASHSKLQTSLVTANPTEKDLVEFNKMHAHPVQYWKTKANVLYGHILHVKTRDTPAAHSGSAGPFHVYFCRTETECMPQYAVLSNLEALGRQACKGTTCCGKGTMNNGACVCNTGYTGDLCEVQVFTRPRYLISPVALEFRSIKIVAGTNDAWFCEYIVAHFGGDLDDEDRAMYDKSNKYLLNSWFSANPEPRSITTGKYYFYENNWRNALQQPAFTFPFPSKKISNEYYLQSDPCNGCSLGYECVQVPIQAGELLWRDFEFKKAEATDTIGSAQATCQPVCGDGLVVADEQCDDANILPDDGCSPFCTVEHAWRCVSNYVEGNARVALRSVCALEFCNERAGASVLTQNYGLSHFQRGHQIGYICSESAARTIVPRDDTFLRCYAWTPLLELPAGAPRDDICPSTLYQYHNFQSLKGTGFDTFSFRPQRYTKVDCRAFDMIERPPGRTVDTQLVNQKKDAPFRTHGYRTKEECRDACFVDPDCVYSQFWIQNEAPSDCDLTFDCHSFCKIVVAYTVERAATASEKQQFGPGYSYLYQKARRAGGTQTGDYYCGIQKAPQPVSAYYTQDFGAAIVLFSDAIQGVGPTLFQEGFCTDYVAGVSNGVIGGTEAQCIWKSPKHLYVQFGGRAMIGNTEWALTASVTATTTLAIGGSMVPTTTVAPPRALQVAEQSFGAAGEVARLPPHDVEGRLLTTTTSLTTHVPVYDHLRQIHGGPSFVVFKSPHLRPRGQPDFPVPTSDKHYPIPVRSPPSLVARSPQVMLKAPDSIGTCSDVEFEASQSHTSGMRRWASVKWTCMETRPMDENDLMQVVRDILYNYCETHIQPLLDSKPWCGSEKSNDPSVIGVRPCDLKVVLPLSVVCQLQSVSLRVEVGTFNGMTSMAEATATRGSRNPFLPMARAIGPSSLTLPMEIDATKPIRFEVTTKAPEYLRNCYTVCPQSSPFFRTTASVSTTISPLTDQSQEELAGMVQDFIKIRWYYGNWMMSPTGERTAPSMMELFSVEDQNESVNQNVLLISQFRNPHLFYQPGAIWYFAAAVTYSTRAASETAFSLVPFEVKIDQVQQVNVHLRAPLVVQGTTCGFIVDAHQTSYTELRAWSHSATERRQLLLEGDAAEDSSNVWDPKKRKMTAAERKRILKSAEITHPDNLKRVPNAGFSEKAFEAMEHEREDDMPVLARWLEAGGTSFDFLRALEKRRDDIRSISSFDSNRYKHLKLPGMRRQKNAEVKALPSNVAHAGFADERALQNAGGFSSTTTTTTKTFAMSQWDGLTHLDDPRFLDCFETFPDLKEIENPTPAYNLRNICLALNSTTSYHWCAVSLESARVSTQTLSPVYCELARTNCTRAVSPPIPEPSWCKIAPIVVDPDSVTFVGSEPTTPHRMVYRWGCRMLPSTADDEDPASPTPESIMVEVRQKLEVCQNAYGFVPAMEMPVGLRAGIYEFTVEVYDRATQYMVYNVQRSILVQVLGVEAEDIFPVHIASSNFRSVVTDMGRGPTCIRADDKSEKRFMMRFRGTDPRENMRNMVMIDMENTASQASIKGQYPNFGTAMAESVTFEKYRRDLGFTITETTSLTEYAIHGYSKMLSAGFTYDFFVVGAEKKAPTKVTAFFRYTNETNDRLTLTAQFPEYPYRFPEETIDPDGTKKMRGVSGPMLEPAVAPGTPSLISVPTSGVAVKDMFKMDQIWSSNYAPLEYKYVYAEVPPLLHTAFVDCRDFDSDPVIRRNATSFLAATLQPVLKEMREYSYRTDMETTFAQGNYLVGGIARDRLGATSATYACVEVTELHREDATFSPIKKLEALDEFVRRSSDALSILRGHNQPGGEIAFIYEILTKDMPNFWAYDWETMAFNNDPTREFVQPLNAAPFVSKEQRERGAEFVRQVLSSMRLAAGQLHSDNFRKEDAETSSGSNSEQGSMMPSSIAGTSESSSGGSNGTTLRELGDEESGEKDPQDVNSRVSKAGLAAARAVGEENLALLQGILPDGRSKKAMLRTDLLKEVVASAVRQPDEAKEQTKRKASEKTGEEQALGDAWERGIDVDVDGFFTSGEKSRRALSGHDGGDHLKRHVLLNSVNKLFHINTLSNSLLLMAKQIGVFRNNTIDIMAADVVNVVMQRFRDAHGRLSHFDSAANEFLEVEAVLLERVQHLTLPRNQKTVSNFNYTDHPDARLSRIIIEGVVNIAEAYVVQAPIGILQTVTAPFIDPARATPLALSISIARDRPGRYETGESDGVGKNLVPNANLVGRWPYPYTRVALMGSPITDVLMNAPWHSGGVFHMNYADATGGRPPVVWDSAAMIGRRTQEAEEGSLENNEVEPYYPSAAIEESNVFDSDEVPVPRELATITITTTSASIGKVITQFPNRINCWDEGETFLTNVNIYSISWPRDPFFYAYGDVGIRNNVSMLYSLGLRSCSQPLLVQKMGVLELDFRLETETVRENRNGYGDMNPYRVVWWREDLIDDGVRVMAGGERRQMYQTVRGWTDGGCETRWNKAQENMVYARCDHIINQFSNGFAGGYQIWGLETLPKPSYTQPEVPSLNKSVHNNLTYWIFFTGLLFYFVHKFASRADKTSFWPSEATLSQILFLVAEQERLERLKEHERLQAIARDEAKDPFYKVLRQRKLKPIVLTEGVPAMLVSTSQWTYEFFFKVNRAQERVKRWYRRQQKARAERNQEWVSCVQLRAEEMLTNEVRELRSMREKTRNRLYEHFFQQTELHPDDIHVDGQTVRVTTIHDLLETRESSEYESTASDQVDDGLPKEPPEVPKLEDVLFDNEEKNELEDLLGLEDEEEGGDRLPKLPPGWQHIEREDTGERAYRNLLTDFIASELPGEPAWGPMTLLPGWMLCYSHKFDRAYYFYPSTGMTQWTFPKYGDEVMPEDPEKHMTLQRMQEMRLDAMDTRPEIGPDGKPLQAIKATGVQGRLVQSGDGRIDPKATSILNETFRHQTMQKSSQDPNLAAGPAMKFTKSQAQIDKETMQQLESLVGEDNVKAADGETLDSPAPIDGENSRSVIDMAGGGAAEGQHQYARSSTGLSSTSLHPGDTDSSRWELESGIASAIGSSHGPIASPLSVTGGLSSLQMGGAKEDVVSLSCVPDPNISSSSACTATSSTTGPALSSSSSSTSAIDAVERKQEKKSGPSSLLRERKSSGRNKTGRQAQEPLPLFLDRELSQIGGEVYTTLVERRRRNLQIGGSSSSSSRCRSPGTPRGLPPEPNPAWLQNPPLPPEKAEQVFDEENAVAQNHSKGDSHLTEDRLRQLDRRRRKRTVVLGRAPAIAPSASGSTLAVVRSGVPRPSDAEPPDIIEQSTVENERRQAHQDEVVEAQGGSSAFGTTKKVAPMGEPDGSPSTRPVVDIELGPQQDPSPLDDDVAEEAHAAPVARLTSRNANEHDDSPSTHKNASVVEVEPGAQVVSKHLEGAHRKSPLQSPRAQVPIGQHPHVQGRPPPQTGQTNLSLALPASQNTQTAMRNTTAAAVVPYRQGGGQLVVAGGRLNSEITASALPRNWEVHVSSDGRLYYVNVVANLTQWELPQLPFPWKERVSRSGKVFYMNDQTGVTQWQWPEADMGGGFDEPGSEYESDADDLEHSLGATSPFELALPGQTTITSASDGAIVPYGKDVAPEATDVLAVAEGAVQGVAAGDKEWGVDENFDRFKNEEQRALEKKRAIARQHRTAHQVRGIRDFVRQHELGAYEQNWGKYLDAVKDKKEKLDRSQQPALGKKMELDKAELRDLFPIVQRLQWTKWNPIKLYGILFMQRNHFVRIFENYARPSKAHRENLWETRITIAAFVISWSVFGSHAQIEDRVSAVDLSHTRLLAMPFDLSFEGYYFLYLFLADLFSSLCINFLEDVFFLSRLELKEYQLDEEQRQAKMKHWHKISATGDAFLHYLKAFLTGLMFIFAAVTPAPRSAVAVLIFLLYLAWLHVLRPLTHALGVFLLLFLATKTERFDGYLSWYTHTMDFLYVSVSTAEFLAWRLHRMMKEAVIMKQVHESEYAFELWQAVLDARKPTKKKSRYRRNLESTAAKYKEDV